MVNGLWSNLPGKRVITTTFYFAAEEESVYIPYSRKLTRYKINANVEFLS